MKHRTLAWGGNSLLSRRMLGLQIREWFPSQSALDKPKMPEVAHGLERDLVTLIGNACFRHSGNQTVVRETKGIPILLSCCLHDEMNPFIRGKLSLILSRTVLYLHGMDTAVGSGPQCLYPQ
jgi:hypothetical protein